MTHERQPPPSVNNQWFNLLGLGCAIAAFIICYQFQFTPFSTLWITIWAYVLPIVLLEWQYLQTDYRASSGLQAAWHKSNFERIFYKLVGLCVTLAIVLFCYWLFPEYRKPEYREYWYFLQSIAPWVLVIAIPYFIYVDGKMHEPEDAYWALGRILCFAPQTPKKALPQYALAWLVKGFFLPLMYIELFNKTATLSRFSYNLALTDLGLFFILMITILFAIDVLIATVGYLFTLRLFDSQIRSTDPTCFGWLVCLACYNPFYHAVVSLYIPKKVDYLACLNAINSPTWQLIWCAGMLFTLVCYVLATVAFGIRFSNLTNRGIITHGVYRVTKHPAYVAKTAFWWLAFIPLASMLPDGIMVLKSGLCILGISVIYYWRAKTEEQHLSKDPAYVQYALWMDEHSVFAPLARYFRFLRYQPKLSDH